MIPVENAPSRKYFIAASIERTRPRVNPARMYRGIESSSRPRKMTSRFSLLTIVIIPATEKRTRA